MADQTRRTLLKQATAGAAVLAFPCARVLGANALEAAKAVVPEYS